MRKIRNKSTKKRGDLESRRNSGEITFHSVDARSLASNGNKFSYFTINLPGTNESRRTPNLFDRRTKTL